jgi:transposase
MMIIGCDFHPRFQQIAYVDRETGEYSEKRLSHPTEAESFYRSMQGQQVRVGLEATGNFRWFQRLMGKLGYELLLGDAGAIRASNPRKQKTDKRDAQHLLRLLLEDRFPAVWQPGVENEELRHLLLHRCRLVRMRTRVENQLDSLAKNEGLVSGGKWSARRRREVEGLLLTGWNATRRRDLLLLLDGLESRIQPLEKAVQAAAAENAQAGLLMTQPGVGPVVSLAYVLTIGEWQRFPRGKHVASYLGLIPQEESSGDKRRLGHISKQGNSMLRWLLVQAATIAQRHDADWHRQYVRLSLAKHHGVAKLAIAHKLAVRLYWMLRSGQNYSQVMERGLHAGQSGCPSGCGRTPRT